MDLEHSSSLEAVTINKDVVAGILAGDEHDLGGVLETTALHGMIHAQTFEAIRSTFLRKTEFTDVIGKTDVQAETAVWRRGVFTRRPLEWDRRNHRVVTTIIDHPALRRTNRVIVSEESLGVCIVVATETTVVALNPCVPPSVVPGEIKRHALLNIVQGKGDADLIFRVQLTLVEPTTPGFFARQAVSLNVELEVHHVTIHISWKFQQWVFWIDRQILAVDRELRDHPATAFPLQHEFAVNFLGDAVVNGGEPIPSLTVIHRRRRKDIGNVFDGRSIFNRHRYRTCDNDLSKGRELEAEGDQGTNEEFNFRFHMS